MKTNKNDKEQSRFVRPLSCPIALKPLMLICVSLGIASGASAQAADSTREQQLERLLIESLNRIEQLENRVLDLEKQSPTTTAAPPGAASTPDVAGPAPTVAARTGSIPLRGFADAGFGAGDHGAIDGFRLGVLDLYLTPQLTENVRGLVELVFEFDN